MKTVAISISVKDNFWATRYVIENAMSKVNKEGIKADLFIFDNGRKDNKFSETFDDVHFRTTNTVSITESYNKLFKRVQEKGYEYICILPSDTLVNGSWLDDLIYFSDSITDSGIVGIRKGGENVHLSPLLNHDHLINVWVADGNFVSGVCLFKTELLELVGGYNENLKAEGFEHDEFCFRVSSSGKRNFYAPKQDSIKTYEINNLYNPKRTKKNYAIFAKAIQEMFLSKQFKVNT